MTISLKGVVVRFSKLTKYTVVRLTPRMTGLAADLILSHEHAKDLEDRLRKEYSHLEMEAALCVWEELNQLTDRKQPEVCRVRENIGSVELRHASIEIGKRALEIYDQLDQDLLDGIAYDWEFIPDVVDMIDWEQFPNGHLPPAKPAADSLRERYTLKQWRWGVEAALQPYALKMEDLGLEETEVRKHARDTPDAKVFVAWWVEKYGLDRAA
ncbi:hypothetical protein [Aureimonas frigidaquae]|uniref:hypothetical protein n=1 Tax=Aureimonas frigidaquae TaxID=424757 RepID=UPI000781A828|nr:hypothetical protein [Aureimonas frigidaquae]